MSFTKKRQLATLALADGTVFHGYSVGAEGETSGEVVFNTSMSGYQEILTDPSYAYQILTFTYPHIGNVGTNSEDIESDRVHVAGMVVREISDHFCNFRAQKSLSDYLNENNVVGIGGIDTRSLVLHIRSEGAQIGVIRTGECSCDELVDKARALPSMDGLDLAKTVSAEQAYDWCQSIWDLEKGYPEYAATELADRPLVVALDFGIKFNILRLLIDAGFRVKVVPGGTPAAEILGYSPDAIFLSNGPGDPAAVSYGISAVKELVGRKPIFGICLGHQILGLALGAETFKLKFGHRGGNHPVRNVQSGFVEITVQNHGFAVDAHSMPKGVTLTHLNLNDQTVEGLELKEAKAFSVQYHPESSPGPRDARYLFAQFMEAVRSGGV